MPFDLASAQPVKPLAASGGFDLASAKPMQSVPVGTVPAFPGSPEDIANIQKSKPLSEAPSEGILDEAKRIAGPALGGLAATGETALHVASSIPPALVGGLSFLGGLIRHGDVDKALSDMHATQGIASKMIYEPRTDEGKAYAGGIEKGLTAASESTMPTADLVHTGLTKIGASPEIAAGGATAMRMLPDVAMQAIGMKGALKGTGAMTDASIASEAAAAAKAKLPPANPTELARMLNIKVKPSETKGQAKLGEMVEGATDSSKLDTQLSIENQPRIDSIVKEEFGLPPDKPASKAEFTKAKEPHNANYAAVGDTIGKMTTDEQFAKAVDAADSRGSRITKTPAVEALKRKFTALKDVDAKDLVHEVRVLRDEARINQNSDKTASVSKGRAQREIANAIEDLLDRTGRARGQDALMDNLKASRVELAKIHSAEEAMLPDGSFDAHSFAKQKKNGVPLSGRLDMLADVAGNHASVTRPALKIRDKTKGSLLNPATYVRKTIASDTYQNTLGKPAAEIGPNSSLSEYFSKPKQKPQAEAAPPKPVLALPAPKIIGASEAGPSQNPGTEFARREMGLHEVDAAREPPISADLGDTIAKAIQRAQAEAAPRPVETVPYSNVDPINRESFMPALSARAKLEAGRVRTSDLTTDEPRGVSFNPPENVPPIPERPAPLPTPPPGRFATPKPGSDANEVTINSANGKTIARKRGGVLQITNTDTAAGAQGKGEGMARMKEALAKAETDGLTVVSDTKVSPSAAKIYDKLEKEGYTIKRNSSSLDDEGNLVSDNGRPIFEVTSSPKSLGESFVKESAIR